MFAWIILIVFFVISSIYFICIITRWNKYKKINYSPLQIKTFDGLDSPFHPSVLFFNNKWNGWKYWMVETPFSPKCKPYVDRNECPSIHVSNNGINWKYPEGIVNPIVNFGKEGEQNLDYYSDPHLVFVNNQIECWYRLTEREGDVNKRYKVSLRRKVSTDGINWSEEEIINKLWLNDPDKGLGKMVVSPAIIHNEEEGYTMWYVDSEEHTGKRKISISTSKDGYHWTDKIDCEFDKTDINPWHIDVYQHLKEYLMVIYDKTQLTLWRSSDRENWSFIKKILKPSKIIGSYYQIGLYRSCLIHDENNFKLFFSSFDYYKTYIGLIEFSTIKDPAFLMHNKIKRFSFFLYCKYCIWYDFKHLNFIIKTLERKLIYK